MGVVDGDDMNNELQAGRISREHTKLILDKLTNEGMCDVDFLAFLTYMPLFVEIHDTINMNPLDNTRDK